MTIHVTSSLLSHLNYLVKMPVLCGRWVTVVLSGLSSIHLCECTYIAIDNNMDIFWFPCLLHHYAFRLGRQNENFNSFIFVYSFENLFALFGPLGLCSLTFLHLAMASFSSGAGSTHLWARIPFTVTALHSSR